MKSSDFLAITISRQYGAGGGFVGQQLANKLNFFFADRVIIREAAKQLSTLEENLKKRDEKLLSFWSSFFKGDPHNDIITIPSVAPTLEFTDHELFDVESGIIKKIANEGSSVILGRCGYHVLRSHPNHLSVFLYGEKDFRIERIQQLYKLKESDAVKLINKYDKERAAYCKTFTGKDWMDLHNYDISINTAKISPENAVDLIYCYVKNSLLK